MQVRRIINTILAASVIALSSCYYDNREELYPKQGCDTMNVSFAAFVKPKIDAQCKACHSGGSPSGGVLLTTHAEIQAEAKSGRLYGVLAWIPPYTGPKQMPPGGPKWSDCDLKKLKSWINKGAPNN